MSADISALIEPLQPFAERLVQLGGRAGVQPRVTSTLRSHTQQKRLYAAFTRGETHYPVAPPGTSAHEFGFAFDMVAATVEDLHDLGSVWRSWGGVWSPNDEVHFQYPGFSVPATRLSDVQTFPSLCTPGRKRIAQVVDFLGGFLPVIGEVELASALVGLGYPDSQILDFLSNPVEFSRCR